MKKILVIDDTEAVREEIVEILRLEQFDVSSAKNGLLGLKKARKNNPDLIVCDILMPEMDGFEILEEIRNDKVLAFTPFIFLTAKSTQEDLRDGMSLGADDYLTKPFTVDELIDAVNIRLQKHDRLIKHNETKFEALCENIIYALPHEFITPLTAILGFSELLIDTSNEKNVVDIAKGINGSAKRFERLIQNFLVYSQVEVLLKSESQVREIQKIVIHNPGTVIRDSLVPVARRNNRKSDLKIDIDEDNVFISTENLQKIVEELVDNAFKFSQPNTPVSVKSFVKDDFYIIKVSDQGRGMQAEQIQKIDSYMQFDRKLYEQQGMGLGLVIAKRLTSLHDGSLIIESKPDQGTTIKVKLKLSSDSPTKTESVKISDGLELIG